MDVKEKFDHLANRVDDLTLRERAIIFAALMLALILGWYAYLMEPALKEEAVLIDQLDKKRLQLQTLSDQFAILSQKQARDPNLIARQKLAGLRAQQQQLAAELSGVATHLVRAEVMPDVIRKVLDQSEGLTLAKLSGLGTTPLVPPETPAGPGAKAGSKPANGAAAGQAGKPAGRPGDTPELVSAYKHGMQIQFSGDFFSTLQYMRKLENLDWRFFWDSVDFSIQGYPDAVSSLRVYTLSLNKGWIGT